MFNKFRAISLRFPKQKTYVTLVVVVILILVLFLSLLLFL